MTWYQKRATKYGNIRTEYQGIHYASKLEANQAMELDLRKRAGEIVDWHRQVKIPLDVNGYHITNYYIDFVADYADGRKEFIEVKGVETSVFRLKKKLFLATYLHQNPMFKYLIVTKDETTYEN